jgi:single-strand DNA-binding protein
MNKVFLKGNMVRDPEIRMVNISEKQVKVANFTIAVSRSFKKANGEKDQDTTFVNCEAWDSGADFISKYIVKGDPMLIEGSLKMENWEKDGQKLSRMKVRVSNFEKLNRAPTKATNEEAPSDY